MSILNLTQHKASPEQALAGVVDLQGEDLAFLRDLLTFEELPTEEEILSRAKSIADLASSHGGVRTMIGGAPFFMGALASELKKRGIEPLYAFSRRVVVETSGEDGVVTKVATFKHEGFIPHV